MCIPELVFWAPFKSETWTKSVGGPYFDNRDNRFNSWEGGGFRFNETGEYRVWATYSSYGSDEGNDHLPPTVDRDYKSNVIKVRVV